MRFLIIDDESLIRKSLARALRSRGHTAMEAENGFLGLDLWLNNEFDLVFLDLVMPDLSGFEVVKRRGTFAEKLVLMTAFSDEEAKALNQLKPVGFLKKPFEDIFAVVDFVERFFHKSHSA